MPDPRNLPQTLDAILAAVQRIERRETQRSARADRWLQRLEAAVQRLKDTEDDFDRDRRPYGDGWRSRS